MHQKFIRHGAMVLETGLALLLFGLLFLTAAYNPARPIIALCFFVAATLFVYLTLRLRLHLRRVIQRLTEELTALPSDLSEKNYDHIQDETQIFYEELTRVKRLLNQRGKMRQELLDIVKTVASNMEFNKLLRELLPRFNEATHSSCSVFYTVNNSTSKLEIKYSVGFSKNVYSEFDLSLGEGLIGQAVLKPEITLHRDIPDDTIYFIRTFLGKIKPRCLMVVPVLTQELITGVLVCASIYDYSREDCEMAELIKHYLGVAVNNGVNYDKTKRLTNELTFQNKLIQDQYEEMKNRLKEKTDLINLLVNLAGDDCLYALDVNGTVLAWNKGAEAIHGIPCHTAAGKKIERLLEEYRWPSIREGMQTAMREGTYTECFWRSGAEEEKQHYEIRLTCMHNDQNEAFGVIGRVRRLESH